MKLYNPTDNDVEITFNGVEYSIKSLSIKDLPEKVAKHWKENIHQFLEINTDTEIITEVTDEQIDEVIEEVVKSTIKKTKTK